MSMCYVRVEAGESIPEKAVKAPDSQCYVAVHQDRAPEAFGFAMNSGRGVEAWFPYGGREEHLTGGCTVLIRSQGYNYTWQPIRKVITNPDNYRPVTIKGISPASFSGRVGKVRLSTQEGWTSWGGYEKCRSRAEVLEALILCSGTNVRQTCHVDYQAVTAGSYPPADAVKAPQCQFQSYVVLSTDFAQPTFGRASLNRHCEGLQAWFPFGGYEHVKENFQILRSGTCTELYWLPIQDLLRNPSFHQILKYGIFAPAVMKGILGKLRVTDMQGWVSYDGKEFQMEADNVRLGYVLCFREKNCSHPKY